MMLATGIVELRPFDGSEPVILLRMESEQGTFDLPISVEQAGMLLQVMEGEPPQVQNTSPAETPLPVEPPSDEMGFGGLKLAADEYEDDDGL